MVSPWATATTNSALLNANQWEHIVYVFNSAMDTIYSYLNGALVNSSKIQSGTTIGQNNLSLLIGEGRWMNNGNPSYLFNGILDDIRIYDIALTPCDVDSLYNMPNPLTGISEIAATKNVGISVFPNPASTEITFQMGKENESGYISIFDMTGRRVQKVVINANKTVLGLADYPDV